MELKHKHASQPIPVFLGQIGGIHAYVCDARELHTFLQNRDLFANWIKQRIKKYEFRENRDFHSFLEKPKGGRPATEYHLSLNMAKELSMVENNKKGKQAHRYFIEMEEKALAASGQYVTGMEIKTGKPKALAKTYHYPRKLLEQPHFTAPQTPASLGVSMLANTKEFVSPLFALLNELRADGHEISAPWDEAVAMREAIQQANQAMEKSIHVLWNSRFAATSTGRWR